MSVTVEDFGSAEFRFRFDQERFEESRLERNRLVWEVIAHGWTHAQVAAATALSRARVGQLVSPRI